MRKAGKENGNTNSDFFIEKKKEEKHKQPKGYYTLVIEMEIRVVGSYHGNGDGFDVSGDRLQGLVSLITGLAAPSPA